MTTAPMGNVRAISFMPTWAGPQVLVAYDDNSIWEGTRQGGAWGWTRIFTPKDIPEVTEFAIAPVKESVIDNPLTPDILPRTGA